MISKCLSVRSWTLSDWLSERIVGPSARCHITLMIALVPFSRQELAWPLCDGRIGSVSPGRPEAVG